MQQNKRKIINDPVYGFITLPSPIVFDLIEHPYFQRLRRIKQLGLTHLVYPGAIHSRFHHALGAMHLMCQAIDVLRQKGHCITDAEAEAATIAILLHDIGHGPYSHSLEFSLIENTDHEKISELFIKTLNKQFKNQLSLALEIFKNTYHKKFLHQLVSSQLDMDRLDYLNRDSFYTGVSEGIVGSDRIIKMLNIVNDELVVEEKGIYSIEKFILARQLMYWQVYLHKTVISAEYLLVNTLKRAKQLTQSGVDIFASPALSYFLKKTFDKNSLYTQTDLLDVYARLDDYDIFAAIKVWCHHSDKVLSMLSQRIINRQLFHIEMQNIPFTENHLKKLVNKTMQSFDLDFNESQFFTFSGTTANHMYNSESGKIKILLRSNNIADISEVSDQLDTHTLSKKVVKYFLCYPKKI